MTAFFNSTCLSIYFSLSISMYIHLLHILHIQGSPDLKAAREVADYLGTRHHEFHFTVQVILSLLRLYKD